MLTAHVWFGETGRPWTAAGNAAGGSPLLGVHDGCAYALLYNGILGDKRLGGGNVLTRATLNVIRAQIAARYAGFDGPLTVYGERALLRKSTLDRESIVFKQTPYEVKARE